MAVFNFWRKPKQQDEQRDTSISSTLNIVKLATDLFGGTNNTSAVTEQTALQLSAVWSCVRVISESFASLPMYVYSRDEQGRTITTDHPVAAVIRNPNQFMTSFVFRQMAMAHVALRGNFYAYIVRDRNMNVVELLPVDASVEIVKESGRMYYEFELEKQKYFTDSTNMLHIKGFTIDGVKGKSVLHAHRDTIGLGLSAQKSSKDFYDNGSKLQGYIQLPGKLDQDTIKKLRESWTKTYGGYGKDKTAILDAGAEYKTINLTPEDAKYLETRKYQKEEIASIFRVPPHMIGIMDRATWSNIEQLGLEFSKYTMLPYCKNWEEEIDTKLFKEREKGQFFTKFNMDGLVRADIKTRYEAYGMAIQNGIKSINEVRALEDMNPIQGGDSHYLQLNMTTIQKIEQDDAQV